MPPVINGTAGVIGSGHEATVARMLDTIDHRGRHLAIDSESDGRVVGFVAVRSPEGTDEAVAMAEGDGRAVAAGGEIYNADELWLGLGEAPDEEASLSELTLALYRMYGQEALAKLNGSFAAVVIDGDRVILARDPLGHSPLYWGQGPGGLFFASEMKALRQATSDINVVPPGNLVFHDGEVRRFGAGRVPEVLDIDTQGAVREVRALLEQAVERRTADLDEVGVWLSGGIDSSAVAAVAARHGRRVHTFSCGAEGAPDLVAARTVAEHLGTRHHEMVVGHAEVARAIPDVVYHLESFDAPLVRSSVANFVTARAAGEEVPVILSGEGGDELFGGYSHFKELDAETLRDSMIASQEALHDTAFQRVDRMAGAAATRSRVPFADPDLVAFANSLPAHHKIRGDARVEKWVLREAVRDLLPSEITWRPKDKFWSGSGVGRLVAEVAGAQVSAGDFETAAGERADNGIRSREEFHFYREFRRSFPERAAAECVGRTDRVASN
jgi:asparagine synthase (glutamine-hydrolysing)